LRASVEIELEERRVDAPPGTVLMLYTDGLTEALSEDGEEFGVERLMAVVAAHAAGSAKEIQAAIMAAYAAFTGGAEVVDDVTCVVGRREWPVALPIFTSFRDESR
jgi:sigma-B regulation protein RsbU (phosphoserine phosphatase)